MANPRFNGRGFTNPLNPLGFHSENRYREPTPLGSNFMEAETRVFHALSAGIMAMIKKAMKNAGEKAFQKAIKKGLTEAQAKAIKEATEKAVKEAMEEAAEKALKEGGEEAAEKAAKEAGEEALEKTMKETAEESVEKTAKEAAQEGSEKLAKTSLAKKGGIIGAGTLIGYGIFAVAGMFGLKKLSEWLDQFAGLNCDENAEDAGLESGTDEYKEYVKECQEEAAKRMMILGGVGILVVGGIAFLLLK